jgi:hypothetical protein
MIAAETIPGMGVDGNKKNGGNKKMVIKIYNSSIIYLIHCKNFYKCHNVPPSSTIKIE